ncbi:hypothetical protein EW145_g2129 [Phellinidium pouzarii]|uniref:Carrier domain-containing protein n=1 Tax=Phellinidium pouzarii TaxID=167371 RepID=A0A4S4LBZ6_9AGAM|nr:hypothetical protein EW145_g2129 [Phellinidium pouzarii]
MRVLLFDGQGSVSATPSTSVSSPCTPLATLFARQAHAELAARLARLPTAIEDLLDASATRSVLTQLREERIVLPTEDATLLCHPLIALPSLYIAQVVRLLEVLETKSLPGPEVTDVVGYSSGLLPALLVATSFPAPLTASQALSVSAQLSILRNALALLDVAILLGMETHVSKENMLKEGGVALDDPVRANEWSVAVFGEPRDALEAKIKTWNAQIEDSLLEIHLTAQTTTTCHTISGLPSTLREFIASETLNSIPPTSFTSACSLPLSSSSSSGVSVLLEPGANQLHSLSRKSSVLSFYTPMSSPFPSPSHASIELPAPISIVRDLDSCCTPSFIPVTPTLHYPSPLQQRSALATKPLGIFALFHANIPHLRSARDNVLAGLFSSRYEPIPRKASKGPTYSNIYFNDNRGFTHTDNEEVSVILNSLQLRPGYALHDMHTSCAVPTKLVGRQLIERVLDMILLERVEFACVLEKFTERVVMEQEMEVVNFGPGSSLARVVMRAMKERVPYAVLTLNDVSVPMSASTRSISSSLRGNLPSANQDSQDPIAIVGMAVNLPGARDADELWRVLEKGINTVEEIPQTRFSVTSYSDANPKANSDKKMKTRFGNFLPAGLHAGFDNAFFRISPREARSIDPQMRVLMRVGLQAMEAAGLVVDEFAENGPSSNEAAEGVIKSEDVGCFVGVATNDYVLNLRNDVGVHYATGTLPAFLAGRLAYALQLSGPSVVLNTACSSSAVAIHQACRALLAGDCKAALAGGVHVVTSPDMYVGLDRGHFLSPTGNCKPWDASADGYCRAEGSGMFVFKRLSDALASSDNILGIIRGTEVNQSAAAISITRPHGPTQAALFRTLLNKAGVLPEEVSLVEAHGTGTQAGDPEELKTLRSVLSPNGGRGRGTDNSLIVTSIKANIGHAEAASGAASLAKVLLMLRHQAIPPQIGLNTLNPKIERLENDFTRINTSGACVGWTPNKGRRIALVNNFGAAGSNAAILVEEAPVIALTPAVFEKGSSDEVLIALTAETQDALFRLRDAYIASVTDSSLVDFAYTATARRKQRCWRLAITADSAAGAARALADAQPMRISPLAQNDEKIIVFVFSGQGGQYLGMGRQLYIISSTFRSFIDLCHEKLIGWGYPGVNAIINSESKCALCNLWESWGILPDAVAGHSLGEYAALVAADVITVDAGLRLVAHRARLMACNCQQNVSGMLVVRLSSHDVLQTIAMLGGCDDISIACYNGAKDTVVGGPLKQLSVLKGHLDRSGAKCINANVPFAYHTAAMDPILEGLLSFARKFDFKAPRIPIVSNVTGNVVQAGDATVFDFSYFAKHCRQSVRFEKGINSLADELESIGAFLELGPHPTTLPMVTHLTSTTETVSLHSLHKKTTARASLCSALSRLFSFRYRIVWAKVYRELYPSARCTEIPGYPLVETEYWVPYVEDVPVAHSAVQPPNPLKCYSFLESWTQKPSSQDGNISEFETPIGQLAEYITGHKVASFPLCPASVYYELALSAASCTLEYTENAFNDTLTLSEVQFTHPLVYGSAIPLTIRTTVNVHPRGGKHAGTFSICSVLNGREQHVHCSGFFQRRQKNIVSSKLQLHAGNVERGKLSLLMPDDGVYHETLRTRTIYDLVFPRVVHYSKLYQVISTMTLDERNGEGFATIRLSQEQSSRSFVVQPVFVDALLHTAGFLINSRAANGEAFICGQVDSTKMIFDIDYSATYEVYCTTNIAIDGMVLADAWAIQTGGVRKVVAHMKRMRFSRLRLNSLSKLLSRSSDAIPRSMSPAPFIRSFERCVTPTKLGSPFSPTHRANTPSSMSSSATMVNSFDPSFEITKLVGEVCGIPIADIHSSSNVADLGIDSLIWIELIGHLKSIVPSSVGFDASEFMLCSTVGDLISRVAKLDQSCIFDMKFFGTSTPTKLIVPEVPLFLSHVEDSMSPLSQVKNILGKVLDISVLDLHGEDSLDMLGLDSLGSMEALQEFQRHFDISLSPDFFRDYPTVDAVQNYITDSLVHGHRSRESGSSTLVRIEPVSKTVSFDQTLLRLQSSRNDASPLFLVHDGSGLSHCYSRIGKLGRSLWGINNPKLLSGESWKGGITEMATHYVNQVKPMITGNGCILGGWSFGGVVAFHMACELMYAGVRVAGVVLIDSPSPLTENPLPEALIDAVIQSDSKASSSSDRQAEIIRLVRTQMYNATQALVAYDPLRATAISRASAYPNMVMLRCCEPFHMSSIRGHPSKRIPFLEDRNDSKTSVRDWEMLIGKHVPVLDIPGHHFEPFAPRNVNILTHASVIYH